MPEHPWPGRSLLTLEDSQLRFLGSRRADLCPATATAATGMPRAHPRLVAALLVDRGRLAGERIHQGQVRREDEALSGQ